MAGGKYTQKQQKILNRLKGPAKQKQMTEYDKQRKNVNNGNQPSQRGTNRGKNGQLRGQQQQQQPRQQKRNNPPKKKNPPNNLSRAFNAFDPGHLPLSDCVAPYLLTNLSTQFEIEAGASVGKVIIVCPWNYAFNSGASAYGSKTGYLTDTIAKSFAEDADFKGPGTHHTSHLIPGAVDGETSLRGRLHNLSVKISCTGTSSGMAPSNGIYMGAVPALDWMTSTSITGEHSDFTIFSKCVEPAMAPGYITFTSAIDLSRRPRTVHSTPQEAIAYREFSEFFKPLASQHVYEHPAYSFEPILIYIPHTTATSATVYHVTVGQQWCTRHPANPLLRSAQVQHAPSPHGSLDRAILSVKSNR